MHASTILLCFLSPSHPSIIPKTETNSAIFHEIYLI
jgi:hypothetical protein